MQNETVQQADILFIPNLSLGSAEIFSLDEYSPKARREIMHLLS